MWSKNLMLGLLALLCVSFAGYGWANYIEGWGWWLFWALVLPLILS